MSNYWDKIVDKLVKKYKKVILKGDFYDFDETMSFYASMTKLNKNFKLRSIDFVKHSKKNNLDFNFFTEFGKTAYNLYVAEEKKNIKYKLYGIYSVVENGKIKEKVSYLDSKKKLIEKDFIVIGIYDTMNSIFSWSRDMKSVINQMCDTTVAIKYLSFCNYDLIKNISNGNAIVICFWLRLMLTVFDFRFDNYKKMKNFNFVRFDYNGYEIIGIADLGINVVKKFKNLTNLLVLNDYSVVSQKEKNDFKNIKNLKFTNDSNSINKSIKKKFNLKNKRLY